MTAGPGVKYKSVTLLSLSSMFSRSVPLFGEALRVLFPHLSVLPCPLSHGTLAVVTHRVCLSIILMIFLKSTNI